MKENMNTINTTKYINMLESNSKFRIELVEQYDNEQIEFKIMRKSNNKQVSYFYIHTNDVITNEKLDNTVYEIYYDNDVSEELDNQFFECDFLASYIFDDFEEFESFVNNEEFDV
jgi:hypothetical protein